MEPKKLASPAPAFVLVGLVPKCPSVLMASGGEAERRRGPRRRGKRGHSSDGEANRGHDCDDEAGRRTGIDGEANRRRSRYREAGRDGGLSAAASILRGRWARMRETMEADREEDACVVVSVKKITREKMVCRCLMGNK